VTTLTVTLNIGVEMSLADGWGFDHHVAGEQPQVTGGGPRLTGEDAGRPPREPED